MTRKEYNQCVDDYSDNVYRFVLKNIKDQDRAQDIVQEAYARLWSVCSDVDAKKARAWLFTTAYNYMIDRIRKDKNSFSIEESHYNEPSSDRLPYSDLQEILHEALEKLPPVQRSVVLLRDYEGYSYEEIGKMCQLSESQVKVYIYRARLYLKKYIVKPENVV
jgi:RNA polymerase sigma-70 factor (ECF subfamily)